MSLTMRYAARSDRGLIRDGNQDSVYAGPRLLAVADGMGGMAAGDVASNIVIANMAPLDDDVPGDALVDALRSAVDNATLALRATVQANPQLEGMGTTLTALLFTGSRIGMVHIGDSRAYLLRDGEFTQVTKDDTYVQMLVDEGRISPEEANSHPQRSLLTRALDGRDVDPEYSVRQVLPGDRYMICSDGLCGVVSAETIASTMIDYVDPDQCVERLVQLALRGGGPDNITVVVADATDADIVESTPLVGGAAANDRGMATAADVNTPAARASALAPRPRPAVPEEPTAPLAYDPRPHRRPRRTLLLTVTVLALLGAAGWGSWTWAQTQYYVGVTDDEKVAVFQGVRGQVAGVRLSREYQASDTGLSELTSVAQQRVRDGIETNNRGEAQDVLAKLISRDNNPNRKPICPPSSAAVLSPAPPSASPVVTKPVGLAAQKAEAARVAAAKAAAAKAAAASASASAVPSVSGLASTEPEDCIPRG